MFRANKLVFQSRLGLNANKCRDICVVAGLLANKPIRRITNLLQSRRYAHRSCDIPFIFTHTWKSKFDDYIKCGRGVVTKTRTTKEKTRITRRAERQTNETEVTGNKSLQTKRKLKKTLSVLKP